MPSSQRASTPILHSGNKYGNDQDSLGLNDKTQGRISPGDDRLSDSMRLFRDEVTKEETASYFNEQSGLLSRTNKDNKGYNTLLSVEEQRTLTEIKNA